MSNRIERANSQIQKALQQILHNHMNDPRITPFVGVSEVKVSPDFRHCKIKIALTDGDYSKADEIMSVLKKSQGYIKKQLSQMLDMPYIPTLDMVFDRNLQNAIRVEEILKTLDIPAENQDDEQI